MVVWAVIVLLLPFAAIVTQQLSLLVVGVVNFCVFLVVAVVVTDKPLHDDPLRSDFMRDTRRPRGESR